MILEDPQLDLRILTIPCICITNNLDTNCKSFTHKLHLIYKFSYAEFVNIRLTHFERRA